MNARGAIWAHIQITELSNDYPLIVQYRNSGTQPQFLPPPNHHKKPFFSKSDIKFEFYGSELPQVVILTTVSLAEVVELLHFLSLL